MKHAPPPPQWDYVLEVYARPGVAQACLQLQARCRVDVVVMLHAMYVFAMLGIRLDATTLAEADARVRPWREQVTVPLRQLRTALKEGFEQFSQGTVDAARQKIKAAELAAESTAFAALVPFSSGERMENGDLPQAKALLQAMITMYSPVESEDQLREGFVNASTQTLCEACLSVAALRSDSK